MRASAEARLSLPRLERWFQGEVARPVERGRASRKASSVLLPSRHLTAQRRLGIYADMYFARLLECLREDYPALEKLAGPEGFARIARGYLRAHPSRHYSLAFLGRDLPPFLRRPSRIPRRALLADVAALERAMSEVFDAQPTPALTPADLALVPPRRWEEGRLVLVDAFRLCAFDHRASAVVTACRQGRPLPELGRARTFVAVYRKEWRVWRMDLTEPMHAILAAIRRGARLRTALAAGARSFDGSAEDLQPIVYRSFREWASEGFFAAAPV